ncbi:hypothetical protein HY029_00110 [Candidatus Gottesmanbacteria bacterium]|nr:hypothetical protein [Candidatus Gottesmanbacteria bacterium]
MNVFPLIGGIVGILIIVAFLYFLILLMINTVRLVIRIKDPEKRGKALRKIKKAILGLFILFAIAFALTLYNQFKNVPI